MAEFLTTDTANLPPRRSCLAGRARGCSVALCLALLAGCGSSTGLYPVAGTVTFEGKPLENGTIQFLTTVGPPGPAGGTLIQQGKYEIPADHGLAPGTYKVLISSPEVQPGKSGDGMSGGFPVTRERIPPKFNKDSEATVEVRPTSSNRFDFTID